MSAAGRACGPRSRRDPAGRSSACGGAVARALFLLSSLRRACRPGPRRSSPSSARRSARRSIASSARRSIAGHGAGIPAAGARADRGQGRGAGRQRGADAARQAHLPQRPAVRDAVRLPARRPAPAALLLRPAGTGDTRGARRPSTRGGAPAPPPPTDTPTLPLGQASAVSEPPRPPLPASAVRLRGLVRDLGGRLQFLPCDGAPLTLEDRTPEQELGRALRELTAGKEGRPMFVELYGSREVGLGGGHRRAGTAPGGGRDGGLPRAFRPSRMDRHGQRARRGGSK